MGPNGTCEGRGGFPPLDHPCRPKPTMDDPFIEIVIENYSPKGRKLWHGGPTIIGCLRGVTAAEAAWKPGPGRPGIWEIALHAAYWKYTVWRRATDAPQGGFPRSPSDFPALPADPTEEAWKEDRRLLRTYHTMLEGAIRSFDPKRLDSTDGRPGSATFRDMFLGIVFHDIYHSGQIQTLKKLARLDR